MTNAKKRLKHPNLNGTKQYRKTWLICALPQKTWPERPANSDFPYIAEKFERKRVIHSASRTSNSISPVRAIPPQTIETLFEAAIQRRSARVETRRSLRIESS
jgi:hypothetical protein